MVLRIRFHIELLFYEVGIYGHQVSKRLMTL
jgi:hypothetical protein